MDWTCQTPWPGLPRAAKTNTGKTSGAAANFVFGLLMPVLSRTILAPEKMFGPVHRFRIDWDAPVSAR